MLCIYTTIDQIAKSLQNVLKFTNAYIEQILSGEIALRTFLPTLDEYINGFFYKLIVPTNEVVTNIMYKILHKGSNRFTYLFCMLLKAIAAIMRSLISDITKLVGFKTLPPALGIALSCKGKYHV